MRTKALLALSLFFVSGTSLLACSCTESRRAIVQAVSDADKYETSTEAGPASANASPAAMAGAGEALRGDGAIAITLEKVTGGFQQPTDIQFPPGHDDKVVILEKGGAAWLVALTGAGGQKKQVERRELFRVDVRTPSEMGLLGVAFHPRFADNGRFYLNYNPAGGALRTRVAEWRIDPRVLEGAHEEKLLLEVEQPYQNHDGGQLQFGPDGFLYIGLGDGGWRADPKEHGQNKGSLLGAMLRIDVDRAEGGRPYGIPKDNPFLAEQGARPEVWAYGLRNPWRYSFDPEGRLIVADVGQDAWEEVSIAERGDNLGWDVVEGRHCFEPPRGCDQSGMKPPIWEYSHDVGQSITGGYVYTGSRVPALRGQYLVADFVRGQLWALALPSDSVSAAKATKLGVFPKLWVTFGRDPDGEVWLADFGAGDIFRIGPG